MTAMTMGFFREHVWSAHDRDDWLNESERRLRKRVGTKKVNAVVRHFKAAAADDPDLYSKLFEQDDPFEWALSLMEDAP